MAKPVPPPGVSAPDRLSVKTEKGGSLVEIFNLTALVREKRLKGESYRDITKEINESGVIPNGYKISHNSIARWCREHGLGGEMVQQSEDEVVNVYAQKCKSLNLVNNAIDIISVELDTLDSQVGKGNVDVKDLKNVIDMLDKMTLRQQTLASEIGAIQEKIYNYENVSRAMTLIRDTLRVNLDEENFKKAMTALGENPMLLEAMRAIAPANI